jgi:hypothetical protein
MRIGRLAVFGLLLGATVACQSDDDAVARRARGLVRPGMTLAEFVDVAEKTQTPDLLFMVYPERCVAPDFQIVRDTGFPKIRFGGELVRPGDPRSPVTSKETSYEDRDEFLSALEAHSPEFLRCKALTAFFLSPGWHGGGHIFDVTFDAEGLVESVGPVGFLDF